ncbi:LIC11270 family surface protein [Leptospira licerasiae]|uniref:LIC11270 family surface protein n=1 Tax=Leptospira licerasiae TaxID=447106 RepID=UPI003017E648
MISKTNRLLYLSSILLAFVSDCKVGHWEGNATDNPVISTLFNSRMLLLMKGTYATDSPLEFSEYNNGTGDVYEDPSGDPTFNTAGLPKMANLPIYIDIGEIRISSKYQDGLNNLSQIRTVAAAKAFWDNVAPNREVYCTQPYTLNANTCRSLNGEFKMIQFLNGEGAEFPSNDPTSGTNSGLASQYYYTGTYIRSLVTGWGNSPGVDLTKVTFFDNYGVYGFNIVPRLAYAAGATDKSGYPLVFPLLYSVQPGEADMDFKPGFEPYIFEVRMNLKENLMLHSIKAADGSTAATLISISDWKVNHQGQTDMGGGILSRSRTIYPSGASSLAITGGSGNLTHYFAVFRENETNVTSKLPLAATPARSGTVKIKYINPGTHKLYCLADTGNLDGFPDTIVGTPLTFSVPENGNMSTISLSYSCP